MLLFGTFSSKKNILDYFFYVLEQKTSTITIKKQLIQTLSIMIQNLNTKNSLYYLLSNNKVNELIVHKFDFALDEELLAYYITFLKTISLKLDREMVQFFFDVDKRKFQLYERAIEFADSNESMVQIAVRTITLNIYSVNDAAMHQFVADTSDAYFERMALYTWDQFLKISTLVSENSMAIETVCADQLDHLYYLGDVFQSCIGPSIEKKLREYLMASAVIPFLNDDNVQLSIKLFFISQLFLIFSYDAMVNDLFDFIFGSWISLQKMQNIVKSGTECEVSSLLCVIYSVLSNREVTPQQLAMLELYKLPTAEDVIEWRPINVLLSESESESKVQVTIEPRTYDTPYVQHPDSSEILANKNSSWVDLLLSLFDDYRLQKIVSYHLVTRVIEAMDATLLPSHYDTVANILSKYETQLHKAYSSTDFVELCNCMGIQHNNYLQLLRMKQDQLFGDPILLLNNPPSFILSHSRTPLSESEELARLMHIVIILIRTLPNKNERHLLLEFVCHMGTPKTEGAQIPLPNNMTYVHSSPYFDYRAMRDVKKRKYGVVLDSHALYLVETSGCSNGFARVVMAISLFYLKCTIEPENKDSMRLMCVHKTGPATSTTVCDEIVVFDDARKCGRGTHVINRAITNAVNERRRAFCRLFNLQFVSAHTVTPPTNVVTTSQKETQQVEDMGNISDNTVSDKDSVITTEDRIDSENNQSGEDPASTSESALQTQAHNEEAYPIRPTIEGSSQPENEEKQEDGDSMLEQQTEEEQPSTAANTEQQPDPTSSETREEEKDESSASNDKE